MNLDLRNKIMKLLENEPNDEDKIALLEKLEDEIGDMKDDVQDEIDNAEEDENLDDEN